jgi:hypothetical protein
MSRQRYTFAQTSPSAGLRSARTTMYGSSSILLLQGQPYQIAPLPRAARSSFAAATGTAAGAASSGTTLAGVHAGWFPTDGSRIAITCAATTAEGEATFVDDMNGGYAAGAIGLQKHFKGVE